MAVAAQAAPTCRASGEPLATFPHLSDPGSKGLTAQETPNRGGQSATAGDSFRPELIGAADEAVLPLYRYRSSACG